LTFPAQLKLARSRLINHSCDPNCIAKILNVGATKKIVIYARIPIEAGDELTYGGFVALVCPLLIASGRLQIRSGGGGAQDPLFVRVCQLPEGGCRCRSANATDIRASSTSTSTAPACHVFSLWCTF
jgi:hypothetical protein